MISSYDTISLTSENLLRAQDRLIAILSEFFERGDGTEKSNFETSPTGNQIDSNIMVEYNTLLLNLRKYKQLDIARIKHLQYIARVALSEGYVANATEVQILIDNVQILGIDAQVRSEDEEERYCKGTVVNYINHFTVNSETVHHSADEKKAVKFNSNIHSSCDNSQIPHHQAEDPFHMKDLLSKFDETFDLVEAHAGVLFHSLKQAHLSDTIDTTAGDIIEEIESDLRASGLSIDNLSRLMGLHANHNGSYAMGSSNPPEGQSQGDPVAADIAFRQFQSLFDPSLSSRLPQSDHCDDGGDVLLEMLDGLRAKHRTVLRKTAALCEPYSPYHIHFKT